MDQQDTEQVFKGMRRFRYVRPDVLLDDAKVIHESTPIQPIGEHGWRDTLVLTFRQGGYQGPN